MTTDLVPADVDQTKVLAALGLNVRDVNAQAALLICQRYELDPLLKHVQLIKQAVYITRDGYLHVAHRSGVFDGMEIVDEGETDKYYWAKVSVFRKDMSRPFTCQARCRKDERTFGDPWDMAITRAERRALKRAFNVAGVPADDGDYEEHAELYDQRTGAAVTIPDAPALDAGQPEDPPLPPEDEVAAPQPIRPEVIPPAKTDGTAMSAAQQRAVFALLHKLGVGDDERHAYVADIIGRPVESFSSLTVDEAGEIITELQRRTESVKQETLA